MAPAPRFYDATGTTEISSTISAAVTAGSSVAAVEYELWNAKAGTADTLSNARLRVEEFDGTDWVTSGAPAVDEGWVKVQLTGIHNDGDADMVPQTTGYVPLGVNRTLLLEDIPQNCARIMNVRIDVPSGQSSSAQEVRLVVLYDESSVVLPFRFSTLSGGGVIPARLDAALRKITDGRTLSAASGEVVTIAKGRYTYDGTPYFRITETVTLNQTAADGALAAGESYIAVISQPQNSAAVATKGNKAASPTSPAVPSGNILLGRVTVAYQDGGTSIITASDINTTGVSASEYLVTAGSGLNVTIGAGSAITTADTHPFRSVASTLAVTDNAASYIWLRPDGTFSATLTSTSPETGSLLLARAGAVGGVVTSVLDYRKQVDRAITEHVMTLVYWGEAGVLNDAHWAVLPFDAYLESYRMDVATKGSAGLTYVDITYRPPNTAMTTAGTTIFTSSATEDNRPGIHGAGTIVGYSQKYHEVIVFDEGTRFAFDIKAIGSGTPAKDITITLKFRKR